SAKFAVSDAGFVAAGSQELLFESSDCSGAPLLQLNDGDEVRLIRDVHEPAFNTFYYADVPVLDRSTCSICFVGAGQTCGATCTGSCQTVRTAPAVAVDVADLGLVPPFHVEGP